MSSLAAGISTLFNTGLEAYAVSQGNPVAVSTSTVGGIPVTSTSVGSIFTGTSGFLIIAGIIVLAGLLLFLLFRRKS